MISPVREAEARLKAAGVCPQCLGRGEFRTLVQTNGKTHEKMVQCSRCKKPKEAA